MRYKIEDCVFRNKNKELSTHLTRWLTKSLNVRDCVIHHLGPRPECGHVEDSDVHKKGYVRNLGSLMSWRKYS